MEIKEINELLEAVSKKRTELKDIALVDLKSILDELKDAQDFIFDIGDRLDRRVTKVEEIIDDIEMEEAEDFLDDDEMFVEDIDDDDDDDDSY